MLWQAMPLIYFNVFWKSHALTLQKMSDKMNTEISDKMVNTQEYNYHKEFVKIVKPMFTDFLVSEYNKISRLEKSDEEDVKEQFDKRRKKFLEINKDFAKYIEKLYVTIAKNTWFCCFYTTRKGAYPNASILEAYGNGMGVFCAFNRSEIEIHYAKSKNNVYEISLYNIFTDHVMYCTDEGDVLSAASDFIAKHTEIYKDVKPFKCELTYNEKNDSYIPDEKTTEILQNVFAALSYCKEYSLDNEKEFRITVMRKISDYHFSQEKETPKTVRLKYDKKLLKELIVLECEYKKLGASLSDGKCKINCPGNNKDCATRTNLFNDIICGSGFCLQEFKYGGSYYKHFSSEKLQDTKAKAVRKYVWDI